MKQRIQYIDKNGEIINERVADFSDSLNDDGYRIPSHKLGARMFSGIKFPAEMTKVDIGAMTILSRDYMIPSANMLGYRKGKRIYAYTDSEIIELVDFRKTRGKEFLRKMRGLGVMKKVFVDGEQQTYINPAYFVANGQRLSLNLFLLFQRELTELIPSWVTYEFLKQAREKAVLRNDVVKEVEESLK